MSFEEMTLPSKDGYQLSLKIYEADEPKAVVKCIHGMEEYQDRYQPFAEFLQAYSAREMNDSTVAVTAVKYNAPKLLSGVFIKQAIKTAGPICVLGFIVCLVCIIVSRRKEEKAKK